MAQYYKGDARELKYYESGRPIVDSLSTEKSDFYTGAFECFVLGELIYDNARSPLSNAIAREIFRQSFFTIFESFRFAGTFESYCDVFRRIFGDEVEITFTVPAAGKLNIDIVATGTALYDFITRYISDDAYVFDTMVDDVGDTIVFQAIQGFESQYELEQMLFEMVPAGIFTEISLTLGS